jgi:hypothetical protein
MTLEGDEVRSRVDAAYHSLLCHDAYLLEVDANERSITHKLAEYLQQEFPEWNVDCEYNRDGLLPKTLDHTFFREVSASDTDAQTVYPDIIVHRRGSGRNLLVIEAKKSTTSSGTRDADKLKGYKVEHGYDFAYAVRFPIGEAVESADPCRDIVELTR